MNLRGQPHRRMPTVRAAAGARRWATPAVFALLAASTAGCSHSGASELVASTPAWASAPITRTAQPDDSLLARALSRERQAVADRDAIGFVNTWDPGQAGTRQRALTIYQNLVDLHAELRPMAVATDQTAGADVSSKPASAAPAEAASAGPTKLDPVHPDGSSWAVRVDMAWRLAGLDHSDVHSWLVYTFVQRGSRAYVADIAAVAGSRTPIWLIGHLYVHRSTRTLVAAGSPTLATVVSRGLTQAIRDVSAVMPGWRGDLVAYAPSTPSQFDALLDSSAHEYQGIAAVTATVDGSRRLNSPVAIVTNPMVFGRLSLVGRHVVISHEATHEATNAAVVDMPLWLAEGFADYVGVGAVHVPLAVSAREVLGDVRADRVPTRLPADSTFTGSGPQQESSYEQARLAITLIAKTSGRWRLVQFYQYVEHHPTDVAAAFRTVLHTTTAAFTTRWQVYLEALADAG
ncbi:MAG: hypothetical protein ACR2KG_00285 [Nocardioidaceae bacterium]